ncbi:MAG TPA: efflux RND transporter periplasmic adaptor subunit [Terriglobales bacterium]|nr:efflux RND transporter periplasmic adaptor subunit [Terriglobales bacterium]
MKSSVLLLAAAILISGCNKGGGAAAKGNMPAMPVPVMTAQPKTVNISSEYLATLKSRNSTTISPQVDGQITQIFVKSGDNVKAGTPLMQIDPLKQQATTGSQEATRASKEANLRLAQDELQRARQLFAAGVVSKQALEQAQSRFDASQADLKAAEAQVAQQHVELRYYRIVAPTSGVVGDIPVHVGDRVSPSTVLTTVNQGGPLEAYIEVPVERARELKVGKKVELLGADGKVIVNSQIVFVAPQVNDATQTVLAKASIGNEANSLRTDQLVRARIVWGEQPAIMIPVLAVARLSGQSFAFVAEQSGNGFVAKQRQLRLGEMIGNDYVVLEGIKAGEKIITGNTQMLGEGSPVQPQS